MPSAELPALPPLPPINLVAPLGGDTLAAWRSAFAEINKGLARLATSAHQKAVPLAPGVIEKIFTALQQPLTAEATKVPESVNQFAWQTEGRALTAFWKRPELALVHLLRFCILARTFARQHDPLQPIIGWWFIPCLDAFRETHPQVGLRELAAGFDAVGLDPTIPGRAQLSRYGPSVFSWPAEQFWPYWSEHLDVLEQYFHPAADAWLATYWKRNALEALAMFPRPPVRFAGELWDLALGTAKTDRPMAQRCLEHAPDKLSLLFTALESGKAETRAAAADWLRRLREPSSVEPLLAAVHKEKNDATKGAMMSALEPLGVPVEQFLDRTGLLNEARQGLAKGLPGSLAWFPFDLLPAVHWADNGERVPPEILRWWLAHHAKLKNPEPGPLLRRYGLNLRGTDRETLGQFVLDAWIAQDTSPIARADAEQRAHQHASAMVNFAQWMANHAKQHPQAPSAPQPPPKTFDEYYTAALPSFLAQPIGSAIASKGILAVAAACSGPEFAPVVQRYLKQWYGMRTAQCRALLQMLAWVDHPSATQVLLATGSRFRTKGIQEEANKQAQALAERKGWSLDELSDRTIPAAGLDENGVLDLDFGPRRFTARLNAKLDLMLFDPEGKPIKTLPDPRKDDDADLAAAAKKLWSAARKELKSVLSQQRDRFYEAMCVQRRWRFEDWSLYLNGHPILRHFTQRLVWAVFRDDSPTVYFRPLPDGSLTNTDDETVAVPPEASIGLAHGQHATTEIARTWVEHLRDYTVEPLFEQFGKPVFTPNDEQKRELDLREFEGHLLEAFKLRGRATKLGYTRGQAEDGGWFYRYSRRFPSLGIEALVEFTGNALPEENRTVALRSLYFQRLPPPGQPGGLTSTAGRLKLGDVPPVLLSECRNDLRQLAAEGPGFDPAWEGKTRM